VPRTPASSGTGNSLGERIAVTDMNDDDSAPTPDDEGRTPRPDDDGVSTPGEEHSGSVPDEAGSASAPDADDRADWRHDVPDPERSETDRSRIRAEEWQDLVRQIAEPPAGTGDMPVDEVRAALDASAHWQPEPAEPIGWRPASPTLVLSWAAALGAVALLLIVIIFFRPLPGWYLLIGLAVGIGGAVGLFFHLPQQRSAEDGDGSSV